MKRRQFLAAAGAGVLTVTLAGWSPPARLTVEFAPPVSSRMTALPDW